MFILTISLIEPILQLVIDYSSVIVTSGPIAVDTFLVLSGFLVSMNILKHLEKYVLFQIYSDTKIFKRI